MSERTFVMVKPDGVRRGLVGEVVGRLERKTLKIVAMKLFTIDKALAETHYGEHTDKPFFGDLVSGPVRKNFGRGIRDIEVRMRRPLLCRWSWRFFTHTLYWDWGAAAATGRSEHIRHLREALDLPGDA